MDNHRELADPPISIGLSPSMRGIERREWSLWCSAVLVTLLLTVAIISFVLPSALSRLDAFSSFSLEQVVRGLGGVVLLFDVYVIHEQVQINSLRRQLTEEIYKRAVLDSLTGLFNRRHIEERILDEMARSARHGYSLMVILFDLDSFKEVNDTYGHHVGDTVLRAFADRLKRATRGSDMAGRYGGDEFLAVLPDCKPDGVPYLLKRMNELAVEEDGRIIPVCHSAGWTEYVPGESLTAFLKRADVALYNNKRKISEK
jgi:diguanylate cyclase (GGDEF)-like protein